MNQKKHNVFLTTGFPIRNSPDQSSFGSSPKLIAARHVLHQLLVPRHPPCTLSSLITQISNCSYTVFKIAFIAKEQLLLLIYFFCFITRGRQDHLLFTKNYGDERDRTANLCLARAALSQLSYTPR